MAVECLEHEAGELGFRDFPGLLTAKENRTGSRQTLLYKWLSVGARFREKRADLLVQRIEFRC
jgi:hypothetical protein